MTEPASSALVRPRARAHNGGRGILLRLWYGTPCMMRWCDQAVLAGTIGRYARSRGAHA